MRRNGSICVLSAFVLVMLCAIFALAVDIGFLCLARTELQAASDSAALAGASALFTKPDMLEIVVYDTVADTSAARSEARLFVNKNWAAQHKGDLDVNLNSSNTPGGDIVLGRWNRMSRTFEPDDFDPFAVRVRIPMTSSHINGQVRLPFGYLSNFADTTTFATAVVKYPVLLPFATSWNRWNNKNETDDYKENGEAGSDGIPEFTIFPGKWNGVGFPPGNFGALSIGIGGAYALNDQIAFGPTASDLASYGGELYEGLIIPGETGVKAGIEAAFLGDGVRYSSIIGEPRYLPIYDFVSGNGANAQFVIRRFVGVRVVAVNLKSRNKWIKLQPVISVSNLLGLQIVE